MERLTGACSFGFGALKEGRVVESVCTQTWPRRLLIGRVSVAYPRREACSLCLWGLWQRNASTEMLMRDGGSELAHSRSWLGTWVTERPVKSP